MAEQSPAEEMRGLVREAHGLLKDLRAERKAIEQLLNGIPAKVNKRIEDAVRVGLETLGKKTREAMDASVAKVFREFDRLEAAFTGTNPAARRAGKPPLEELIRNHTDAKGADRG
jgi:ABC-type transporter MlaC component